MLQTTVQEVTFLNVHLLCEIQRIKRTIHSLAFEGPMKDTQHVSSSQPILIMSYTLRKHLLTCLYFLESVHCLWWMVAPQKWGDRKRQRSV